MQDFNLGEKLSKAGTFIKDNKKPLLYVGGAVAIIVIGYAVVSRTKKGILNVFTDKTKNETPFIDVEVDDTKVTISDSVANSYANQLYNAILNHEKTLDEYTKQARAYLKQFSPFENKNINIYSKLIDELK